MMDPGASPLRGLSGMTLRVFATMWLERQVNAHPAGRSVFTTSSLGRYFAPSA